MRECRDRRPNPDRARHRRSRGVDQGPVIRVRPGIPAAHTGPMDLDLFGWDGVFAGQFAPWADAGHRPGRVIAAHRGGDLVATGAGELLAQATGRLRHLAGPSVAGLPAVGDWAALREGRIHAVLPRRTAVTRRTPGTAAGEQVLAANVDLVVVVVAPGRDANPRRVGGGRPPAGGRARPGRPVPGLGHRRRHRAGRPGRGRPGRGCAGPELL